MTEVKTRISSLAKTSTIPLKAAAIAVLMIIIASQSYGSNFEWLGATFHGMDELSGKTCVIKTRAGINESILGDAIQVEVTIGNAKPVNYELFNHPLIKGNTYGREVTVTVDRPAPQYDVSLATQTLWIEVTVDSEFGKIQFIKNRIRSKPRGEIVDFDDRGEIIKCETSLL